VGCSKTLGFADAGALPDAWRIDRETKVAGALDLQMRPDWGKRKRGIVLEAMTCRYDAAPSALVLTFPKRFPSFNAEKGTVTVANLRRRSEVPSTESKVHVPFLSLPSGHSSGR
jgi:hypothetical protein